MNIQKIIILLICCPLQVFAENYSVLSYEEYAKINHAIPYTFQLSKAGQTLSYFGANHSCDPENEQYPLLEKFWQKFLEKTGGKNCVVLVEGCKRGLGSTKYEAITSEGGEGGLITFLAHESGTEVVCPEPDESSLTAELLKQFSEDEIAYRTFAIYAQQFNRYKKVDPTLVFEPFYQSYQNAPLLERMKEVHFELFRKKFDPHNEAFFYSVLNPVMNTTIINKVCREASMIRDQCIVNYIDTLIQQGKNIFVVYGCTHAVMQEAAIRVLWNK